MPASPATPKAVPPPITPVTTQQSTSEPTPPSPRALNVSPGKTGCESVSVSIPTHQGIMGKSKEDSAPISSKLDDFEKTLQDLDRDIHGFEKVAEDHLVANDSTTLLHQAQSAQSGLFLGPTIGPPLFNSTSPFHLMTGQTRIWTTVTLSPKPKKSIHVDVVSSSPNHIDALIGAVPDEQWRAVASNGWFSRFPGSKVQHLRTHSSDHKAILIRPDGITPRPNGPFKFEQMWLREGGCSETVIKAWGSSSQDANMRQVASKIQAYGDKLASWSQQSFGSIKRLVEKKSKLLSKAEIDAANGKLDYELVKVLKAEVNDLLDKESQMWQQRSRGVVSPREFLGDDARVSVLIDSDHRRWLQDAIDNIFLPHEAALIQSIPLSIRSCEDQFFWLHTPDGLYSVSSGYKLLLENEGKEEASTSDLTATRRLWMGVWSLRVPNRVKTVLWRAGLDSLPSKANLKKRKIVSDDLCPGCSLGSESTMHALWSCSALTPVWATKFAWLMEKTSNCLSLMDVIQCCQENSDCLDLFAMIISQLWSRRNKLRVGDHVAPLAKINALAADSLLEFQCAQSPPQPSVKKVISSRWSPPPMGWAKINFDGATFKDKNLAGLGGVIRNDKGLVMAAFT
nr:putative ribonuclease h protein [Quercus suber]